MSHPSVPELSSAIPVLEPLGDAALVAGFGDAIDPAIHARVMALCNWLRGQPWPGIQDIVPAYTTVTVFYALDAWDFETLARRISAALPLADAPPPVGALVEIPVCYDAVFAPDMESVCAHSGLSRSEVIRRHHAPLYPVYFLGFTPGFAYLGGLDASLHTPRRATPRQSVPAGSVAIGEAQTGIYPLQTPGGWNLIGRTPLRLFDALRSPPCLLQAGDRVRFVPISMDEFAALEKQQ